MSFSVEINPPHYNGFRWVELDDVPTLSDSEDEMELPLSHEEYLSPRSHEPGASSTEEKKKRSHGRSKSESIPHSRRLVRDHVFVFFLPAASCSDQDPASGDSANYAVSPISEENDQVDEKEVAQQREQRKRVVQEIMTTEKTYVANIELCLKCYQKPLLEQCEDFGESVDKVDRLFGNLAIIAKLNAKVLTDVTGVVSQWSDVTSMISPTFLRFAPFLKMYTAYSNKFEYAMREYRLMLEKNHRFAAVLAELHAQSHSTLDLGALLIQPIQRIPRYSLLLRDLLKSTPPSHPDYTGLQKSLILVEEVASHINEEVRRAENQEIVEKFSQKGVSLGPLVAPHRFLVKEGVLKVIVTPSAQQLQCRHDAKAVVEQHQLFLFNDLFVHIKKSDAKNRTLLPLCLFVIEI